MKVTSLMKTTSKTGKQKIICSSKSKGFEAKQAGAETVSQMGFEIMLCPENFASKIFVKKLYHPKKGFKKIGPKRS